MFDWIFSLITLQAALDLSHAFTQNMRAPRKALGCQLVTQEARGGRGSTPVFFVCIKLRCFINKS